MGLCRYFGSEKEIEQRVFGTSLCVEMVHYLLYQFLYLHNIKFFPHCIRGQERQCSQDLWI
jgi:hypothetical protein